MTELVNLVCPCRCSIYCCYYVDTNRDVLPDDLVSVFYKQSCQFGFATHLFGSDLKVLFSQETAPRGIRFRISPTSHSDL